MEKKIRMIGIDDLQEQIKVYQQLIREVESVIDEVTRYSQDDHPHLIPDSEFEEYVKYMITDMYELDTDIVIVDWEKTTKLVKETYNHINYKDETYWYR
jgi:hypothetical protein